MLNNFKLLLFLNLILNSILIMKISILTFQEFNELDSLIVYGILNHVKKSNWQINICSPDKNITSMNNLKINSHSDLSDIEKSDVVIVGSGMKTREIANDSNILNQIKLNPQKQIICSQCSGALILSKLSLLENIPVCTDLIHKKFVEESGVIVLDQPFYASGNIASAGGCLSSQYLAFFVISKILDIDNAIKAIYYFAPTGQKDIYVDMAISNVKKYL